jgi:hypothetical protein
MSLWLRQSTTASLKIGPFVGTTDGYTAASALVLAASHVRLAKNGANFAAMNSASLPAHNEYGFYTAVVSTSDTDTVGRLQVSVNTGASALPVWGDYTIVSSPIYDALIAGTSYLPVALSASAVDDVWNEAQSGHTTASTFGVYLDAKVSGIVAGSSATSGIAASDVWAYGTRTLTDKVNYGLSASALTEIATSTSAHSASQSASSVWTYATRNLTDKIGYGLSASALNEITTNTLAASTVWGSATRTLTDKTNYGLSASALTEITTSTSAHSASQSASSVWTYASRAVTDKLGFGLSGSALGEISGSVTTASAVWTYATRNLTDKVGYGVSASAVTDVWAAATRTLTDKVNYGLSASALTEITTSTSAHSASQSASSVWTYATRNLTDKVGYGLSGSALSEISASVSTASGVWTYASRTLTDKANYGLSTSALNEITTNTLAASTVWNNVTRALTDKTNFGLSGSALTEISASTTGASGVWTYGARALTDKTNFNLAASAISASNVAASALDIVWDTQRTGHISPSTFGQYLDTNVSSVTGGSGGLTADAVWTYGTRVLTDKVGYGLSASALNEITTNTLAASTVWGSATRTLTDKVNYGLSASALTEIVTSTSAHSASQSASSVWTYTNRSVTDKTNYGLSGSALGEIAASLGGNSISASDIWNHVTRTLTDKVGYGLSASAVDDVWNESQTGHITASTFGSYLDAKISGVVAGSSTVTGGISASDVWVYNNRSLTDKTNFGLSASALNESASTTDTRLSVTHGASAWGGGSSGGVPTVSDIVAGVWNEPTINHAATGTTGKALTDSGAAGNPWEATVRTLTQTAAQVQAAVTGPVLNITNAVTYNTTLTGLVVPAAWSKVYFTIKNLSHDPDTSAILQLRVSASAAASDGLLRVNGVPTTASYGSLVVNQAAGTVDITISDDATAIVEEWANKPYDLKAILTNGDSQLLTGNLCNITATPTQSID